MGTKGTWHRPDPDDNFRKNRDLIDWSAKGEKPKPEPKRRSTTTRTGGNMKRAILIICMLGTVGSVGVLALLKNDCDMRGWEFKRTDAGYVCVRGKA